MKPLLEVRQRLQMRQQELNNFEYGKPDELSEVKLAAIIQELIWVLGD